MAKQVVVIGGGMAGTSAAYSRTRHDYKVTILEKESRLGGRMYSEILDGATVELGTLPDKMLADRTYPRRKAGTFLTPYRQS